VQLDPLVRREAEALEGAEEVIEDFWVFECCARGADVEFFLNGIPVIVRGPSSQPTFGGPVNHLLVEGRNEIAMVVRPGELPRWTESGPYGPKPLVVPEPEEDVWASLSRYPFGATVGGPDGLEFFRAEWPARDARVVHADPDLVHAARGRKLGWDDRQPACYPVTIAKTGKTGKAFGRWTWQDAPELQLDEKLTAEVLVLLNELRDSLAGGDTSPYIARQRTRLDEVTRAYDLPPGQKESLIRLGNRRDVARPDFGFEPIDPEQLDLRLVAGGRLVECLALDREPVLREKRAKDGSRGLYPLLLGRVGEKLEILR
jgi:hypothetical protein